MGSVEDKQKDLTQLEHFVRQENLTGWVNHVWYSGLRSHYPLEFIRFMKKHNKTSECDIRRYHDAIKRFNDLFTKLNTFLVIPPLTDKEKQEFNIVTRKLEELLLKQNKIN